MLTSLYSTERRLITLFVGGAFLFLIIFEAMFITSRMVFEENISETDLASEIIQIENRRVNPQ
jgi:hypothetical protein